MSPVHANDSQCIEWAAASRTIPGQVMSGDLHLVTRFPNGALAAVVDGLGHGQEAGAAARAAVNILAAHAGESPIPLVQRCHHALRATRGAVMTLVSFNALNDTVTAVGIGNVEAVLLRADRAARPAQEHVLLRGGIVGDRLPALQASLFPVYPGDILLLATDGIRPGFGDRVNVGDPLQPMADRILARDCSGTDDALVLAVRYLRRTYG